MRFAAKEAFSKALGVGLRKNGIRWREVEVVPNPLGKPEIFVSGRAAALCAEAGITGMHLSLTDEDGLGPGGGDSGEIRIFENNFIWRILQSH